MTTEAQVSLLEDLTAANEAYRAGKATMPDHQYDAMLDELARTDPGNKFLHTVEPEKSDRQKVKHVAPMLSTEKAYTVAEIENFHGRVEQAIQELGLDSDHVHFAITHKLDGMAAHWDGEKLLSRGDGEYGFDITDALDKGLFILGSTNDADLYEPMDDEAVAIKLPSAIGPGEIVVAKRYFEEHLADKYTHPRNFITGAILSDTLTPEAEKAFADKAVVFYPFASLYTMNGQSAAFDMLSGDLLEGLLDPDWFPQISFECDYPIDGLVVEVTNPTIKEFLGSTSHHHRWQIAFKRKGETAETT
ncbi:MAG TPA: hypothetical protein DCS48_07485, partial [Desulfovibrio sp.]|nr:hypothetical protein [Desulfovibrio sp.]